MALYSIALRKSHDIPNTVRRKWSNVFFYDAPSAVAAAAAGVALWTGYLRDAARTRVFCYEVYATSMAEGDDDYKVQAVGDLLQRGTLATPSGEAYFRDVCVSVTIPASSGRPSRKFWRPGLFEADIGGGEVLLPALATAIESVFNNALESAGTLLDVDGQVLEQPVRARLTRRALGRESAENLPAPPTLLS